MQSNRKVRSLPIRTQEESPTAATFLINYLSSSPTSDTVDSEEVTVSANEASTAGIDFKQSVMEKMTEDSEIAWHNTGVVTTEFDNIATEPESAHFHTYRFTSSTRKYLQGTYAEAMRDGLSRTTSGDRECRCYHAFDQYRK